MSPDEISAAIDRIRSGMVRMAETEPDIFKKYGGIWGEETLGDDRENTIAVYVGSTEQYDKVTGGVE
jgi:hypothetical protein